MNKESASASTSNNSEEIKVTEEQNVTEREIAKGTEKSRIIAEIARLEAQNAHYSALNAQIIEGTAQIKAEHAQLKSDNEVLKASIQERWAQELNNEVSQLVGMLCHKKVLEFVKNAENLFPEGFNHEFKTVMADPRINQKIKDSLSNDGTYIVLNDIIMSKEYKLVSRCSSFSFYFPWIDLNNLKDIIERIGDGQYLTPLENKVFEAAKNIVGKI